MSAGDCRSQLGFVGSPVASFGPHLGSSESTMAETEEHLIEVIYLFMHGVVNKAAGDAI